MTPSARLQAAIEILDTYIAGSPVEKALTNWARKSRFAGSKDRAAVRDIVFQCVRCRLSYGCHGGSDTGRGLVIGYAADYLEAPETYFDGSAYGPEVLTEYELKCINNNAKAGDLNVALDVPEWLLSPLQRALGDDLKPVMERLRSRAPVFVRVNKAKTSVAAAQESLSDDGILTTPHALSDSALEVVENPRKINNSNALRNGLIELQDVASQAVCQAIPRNSDARILDYCAGGGGKSLALADGPHKAIYAHDSNPARMGDIAARAARSDVRIETLTAAAVKTNSPYDIVFCDVPCSGSGAWRRSPEGKWALDAEKLGNLVETQRTILVKAANLVAPQGLLAYATCSMLCEENEDQINQFLQNQLDWELAFSQRFSPLDGGDGFFVAHLTRKA